MAAEPVLVTVRDAAAMLSISRSRIYELLADGGLASHSIGRARRISMKSIRHLLAETVAPPQRARRRSSRSRR